MSQPPHPALPLSAEGKPMIGIVSGATIPRGLDHLVVGVRDLDAAAAFYEKLGFQAGQRNHHPWDTENRIVQFAGSFLELITVPEGAGIPPHSSRQFSFGAFVKAALERGEGLSMLVLDSIDAKADAAAFSASGIGDFEPFFFERQGRKPDGSPMRLAFTLAFAQDMAALNCGFFTCQHHEPQNFWNPAFQTHGNGATGIAGVMMSAENPADHHIFLEAFTGLRGPRSSSMGLGFTLARGDAPVRLDVVTPQAASALLGDASLAVRLANRVQFMGFSVAVPDIAAMAARLTQADIPFQAIGQRLVVPAEAAFGTAIIFQPQT